MPIRKTSINVLRFNDISSLLVSAEVGGYRAEILYGGVLGEKWWRNYLHVHSFFEVCYVYSGNGTFRVENRRFPLARGDAFIAKPGEPHEIVSSRRQVLGIYFWAFTLSDRSDVLRTGSDTALAEVMRRFLAATASVIRIASLEPLLRLMTEELGRRAPGYIQMIDSLFAKVIVDTARAVAPKGIAAEVAQRRHRSAAEGLVQTAEQYLRDNLDRSFEVREVAAQVNLSERQLTRLFRRFTGTSVLAYLTNLRINRASQLLLNTDLPIKQVASEVGYPDTHYFTTLFGRHTGTTPGTFRNSKGTQFLAEEVSSPASLARRRKG